MALSAALLAATTAFCAVMLTNSAANAATPTPTSASLLKPATAYTSRKDIRYSTLSTSNNLKLDLYTPNNDSAPDPLIIYVHGGGWIGGSKNDECPPFQKNFMKRGWAVACVNYRLSTEAQWPAQIIDVKSAVRFLRANATTYKLYAPKIGMWGGSAGGQLTAMAATSANIAEFDKGQNLTVSSSIQAARDDFGPTDFVKWVQDPCCTVLQGPFSYLNPLFGGPVLSNQAKAATASPMTYVNGDEPPISIAHGDADTAVPYNQSQLLYSSLLNAGDTTSLEILPGLKHADAGFYTTTQQDKVSNFFNTYLRP